jgi:transcription termination/antitermination protein NusA
MPKRRSQREENDQPKAGEFGSAIAQICEEKGIAKDKVIETIEAALSAAYKKDYGKRGQNIKAVFNEVSGEAKFWLVKEVVDETIREFYVPDETLTNADETRTNADKRKQTKINENKETDEEKLPRFNPERDLTIEESKKFKKKAKIGDIIEIPLEEKSDYGRVAAQTAKQVIIQRIREAERDAMFEEYRNKEGEVINGTVQRVEGRNVFIDLGKSVGVLFPSEQIERENYRVGQRIKVFVAKVDAGTRGPGITLSRVHPDMVKKLFEVEVPEIFAETVVIKEVAREAGERTKIAVTSNEEGIDPIGSCVGQKGTRVQTIIEELGGEKIDIILWNADPAKFISASLSPAKVIKVEVNEENKTAQVWVMEDHLSLAIGKKGQNVRLAAKLTGWKIDIIGLKPDGAEVGTAQANADETQTNTEKEKIEEKAEEIKEENTPASEEKEVEEKEE